MQTQRNHSWPRIVAKAWSDDAFKARLIAQPENVLTENGFEVESGTKVVVVEGATNEPQVGGKVLYLNIPAKPAAGEVVEEDLSTNGPVALGGCEGCCASLC